MNENKNNDNKCIFCVEAAAMVNNIVKGFSLHLLTENNYLSFEYFEAFHNISNTEAKKCKPPI